MWEGGLSGDPVVYMIASTSSPEWYIGKTVNFGNRLGTHCLMMKRATEDKQLKTQHLYRTGASVGWWRFVILPIVLPSIEISGDGREIVSVVETHLIKLWRPTLNSAHAGSPEARRLREARRKARGRPQTNKRTRKEPTRIHTKDVIRVFTVTAPPQGKRYIDLTTLLEDYEDGSQVTVEVEGNLHTTKWTPPLDFTTYSDLQYLFVWKGHKVERSGLMTALPGAKTLRAWLDQNCRHKVVMLVTVQRQPRIRSAHFYLTSVMDDVSLIGSIPPNILTRVRVLAKLSKRLACPDYVECALVKQMKQLRQPDPCGMSHVNVVYYDAVHRSAIREFARRTMTALEVTPFIRCVVNEHLRVVFKHPPSIGDMMTNYRQKARAIKFKESAPLCRCSNRSWYPKLPRTTEEDHLPGHIHFVPPWDTCCTLDWVKPLRHHLDFIPEATPEEGMTAMGEALHTAVNVVKIFSTRYHAYKAEDILELEEVKLCAKTAMETAKIRGLESTVEVETRRHDQRGLREQLEAFKRQPRIRDDLMIGILDKNDKCASITCLTRLKRDLERTYTCNLDHYAHVTTLGLTFEAWDEGLVQLWKTRYKDLGLQALGTVDTEGKMPAGYIIPKSKDINKWRPIVAYTHHPARRMLHTAARALNYLVEVCPVEHCNMQRVDMTAQRLQDTLDTLVERYPEGESFILMGDVKNMYTNLRHRDVLDAIRWFLDIMSAHMGSALHVPGRKDVKVTRGALAHPGRGHNVTFELIFELVKCDIENTLFSVGSDTLMRQTRGIPMGSNTSPTVAVITCMRREHINFTNNPYGIMQYITPNRFIDDAIILGRFPLPLPAGLTLQIVADRASHLYDADGLTLEMEPVLQKWVRYLTARCALDHTGTRILTHRYHPNVETLLRDGSQKVVRYARWDTATPRATKRATIKETLRRVLRATTKEGTLPAAEGILLELAEYRTVGTPFSFLRQIVVDFLHTDADKHVWLAVEDYLTNHWGR